MPRFALTRVLTAVVVLAMSGLLLSCGSSNKSTSNTTLPPNIAGSWEFLAVSKTGAQTGIEVQVTQGQMLDNGLEVPSGQIAADSAQMTYVTLTTANNQNTNISGFGGSCDAMPTSSNAFSGTITAIGSPINFTFTANGSIFNVTATLSDSKTIVNGTYTPQEQNACTDPGGTISGLAVSVPTGQYTGQMCSPSLDCSTLDSVTATVTAKSGQDTINLMFTSGPDNGTTLTLTGPGPGYAFTALGTYQGSSVTYYGYFEQVYNATLLTNVQSMYLVDSADPCFANPGTNCTTATILQVPQTP